MRTVVLDACTLIGFLEPEDAHHNSAIAIMDQILSDGDLMLAHMVTIAEVLVHPARQGLEHAVLEDLRALGIQDADVRLDAPTLASIRAGHRLKMPDAIVLATALDLASRPDPAGARDVVIATLDDQLADAATRAKVGVVATN